MRNCPPLSHSVVPVQIVVEKRSTDRGGIFATGAFRARFGQLRHVYYIVAATALNAPLRAPPSFSEYKAWAGRFSLRPVR